MAKFQDDTKPDMPARRPDDHERRILAKYVAARLHKEKSEAPHGFQARVARETNFKAPHVSNVIDGSRQAGDSFIKAMAAFWHISLEEMKQRALHFNLHGWATDVPIVPRFPNRDAAITTFGHQFSPESIARLREVTTRSGHDMPSTWWLAHLGLIEEDLRAEQDPEAGERRRGQDLADTERAKGMLRKQPTKPAKRGPGSKKKSER